MSDYQEIVRKWLPPPGDFEQCYAFSLHKAGSTLMHTMIGEVCEAAGIPAINIPYMLFREGVTTKWESDPALSNLVTPGRVYFGFRFLPQFVVMGDPDLSRRPTVLLVRDPRDALVSQYFSFGGRYISHRLPEKNSDDFIARVRKTADLEIDEYVIEAANDYARKMQAYLDVIDLGSIRLFKYEDIYFDKRKFLEEIFRTFRLRVSSDILDRVAAKNDIRPESERLNSHIRKGLPGDHCEKLQPETIDKLNEIFRKVVAPYGYDFS